MRALMLAALASWAMAAWGHASAEPALGQASEMMAANWRPFQPPVQGEAMEMAVARACEGAADELAWLEQRLPETLTPEALSAVRTPRGLILVPTDENPATLFLFAATQMPGLASGLASIRVVNARLGHVDLIDASGT